MLHREPAKKARCKSSVRRDNGDKGVGKPARHLSGTEETRALPDLTLGPVSVIKRERNPNDFESAG